MSHDFSQNMDTIVQTLGIGMWDWDLTTNTFTYNDQLAQAIGYSKDELPGDFGSIRSLLFHPEDKKRADTLIQTCIEGQADTFEIEMRLKCKNGGIKWIQDRGAVVARDGHGAAQRIVGMFADINRFKSTEALLKEQVQRMDVASNLSGLTSIEGDLRQQILRVDRDFLSMLGYPEDVPLTQRDLRPFIDDTDYPSFHEGMMRFIEENDTTRTYAHQMRLKHRDGQRLWVSFHARIVESDADGATRVYASILDVDKRVRTEIEAQNALRENQWRGQQLQEQIQKVNQQLKLVQHINLSFLDANPHINIIFDDKFKATDCNLAFVEFMGCKSKTELLDNFAQRLAAIIPAHQPDGRESIPMQQRLLDTRKYGINDFETMFVVHGKPITMRVIMKRIDYNDSFAIAGYMVDVTDIRAHEQELLHQDRLLQAANTIATMLLQSSLENFIDTLRDSLHLLGESVGVDRAYVWKNEMVDGRLYAEELCEWCQEGVSPTKEHSTPRFCYNDTLPDWQTSLLKAQCLNAPIRELPESFCNFPAFIGVQSVLMVPIVMQGSFWGFLGFDDCRNASRYFSSSKESIMHSVGTMIAAAVLRNQISESLIAAKEAALEGSRAKSDFLSRMSHEIRTPMNAIIGMTNIARKSEDLSRIQYCLDRIDGASQQLLDLINNILDMSKIEANKLVISPHPFDLERMLQNVYNVVNVKMEEKHLYLAIRFQKLISRMVICDELRLSQVLINLLNNAAKFTPEYGNITVNIRCVEQENNELTLHFEVQDTGIGISKEQQERLFDAFEQADVSTTRKYGGTGLGLAICRSIVHLMGGDIQVHSEADLGACFAFYVRCRWGDTIPLQAPLPPSTRHMRTLSAYGSHDLTVYLQHLLSTFSLQPGDIVTCLEEAMYMAEHTATPYDIFFVHGELLQKKTSDFLRRLRSALGAQTKIVITSITDPADVEQEMRTLQTRHILTHPTLPSMMYNLLLQLTDAPPEEEHAGTADEASNWKNKSLLLAEDVEINTEIMLSLLEDTGIRVTCASDGLQAVETYRQNHRDFDLILMDIQMPHMDGLEATRQIRASALPGCQDVPIIAMTANAFKEDVKNCLDAGMNGHIAKPIDIEQLFQTLSTYLDSP